MAYSKQAANENKKMLERALDVIIEIGWNLEDERDTTGYYGIKFAKTLEIISDEFPDITELRIKQRVAKAFRILRGKAINGITPHKGDESGGRAERFEGRCTKRIKQMANEVKKETGLSDADIYYEAILDWHKYLFGSEKDIQ